MTEDAENRLLMITFGSAETRSFDGCVCGVGDYVACVVKLCVACSVVTVDNTTKSAIQ